MKEKDILEKMYISSPLYIFQITVKIIVSTAVLTVKIILKEQN